MQGTLHVRVSAAVTRPEQISSDITNTFLFCFEVDLDPAGSQHGRRALKRVLPSTEEEALMMQRVSEQ